MSCRSARHANLRSTAHRNRRRAKDARDHPDTPRSAFVSLTFRGACVSCDVLRLVDFGRRIFDSLQPSSSSAAETVLLTRAHPHTDCSAEMAATDTLSRPISVYSIPPPLLDVLTVRSIQAQPPQQPTVDETGQTDDVSGHEPTATASTTLGCQTCPGASFDTPDDQRAHFKSDWHRYNAKAKVGGHKIVTAEEWDNMVEGELSSSRPRTDPRHF